MLESHNAGSNIIGDLSSQTNSKYRVITEDNPVFKMRITVNFFHILHELCQVCLTPGRKVSVQHAVEHEFCFGLG
jgi:hypothetical protein